MKVLLQPVTSSTAGELLEWIRRYYEFDHIPFDKVAIERGIETLLRHPEFGIAWLIAVDGKTAGYLNLTYGFDLEFGGQQATITDLFLDPGFRGKQVGSKVMEQVAEFAKKRGLSALELQHETDNDLAHKFYVKHGFEAHDRVPMSKRL